MKTYNIALLKGDGIGPEIVDSAVRVLECVGKKLNIKFNFTPYLIGGIAIDETAIGLLIRERPTCRELPYTRTDILKAGSSMNV